jgi:hypothetical protein
MSVPVFCFNCDPYKLYEDLSFAQITFAQKPRLGDGTSPVAV